MKTSNTALECLSDFIEGLTDYPSKEELHILYGIYLKDFVQSTLIIDEQRTIVNKQKLKSSNKYDRMLLGKQETFCHIVTRGKGKRVFDANRANKIHWIKVILENRNDSAIKYFEAKNDKEQWCRFYWYKSKSYIVILKEISLDLFLITGYCVDPSETIKFNKQWQAYESQQNIQTKKNLPRR
ncbi:MAG: hypothetical protein ACRC13_13335 [Tannerellaceae bacterium]